MGKLKLSEILEKLWTYLIVDFITKLPIVARKDVILVVCDKLFKMIYFVATTEGTSTKELARLFRDNVWKLHRLLESIILDRGLQFVAEIMKELNRMLEIETRLSTLYYLQTDRQMKRMNQDIIDTLDTNNFFFFYFLDCIFSFLFLLIILDDEEACDTTVT